MSKQTYILIWDGVEIEANYEPDSYSVVSHLEIISINPPRCKLPMTETGYRSHFHERHMIERDYDGDVIAAVLDWLNIESKSKRWQKYLKDTQQGSLF